jgi:hypothetical protein
MCLINYTASQVNMRKDVSNKIHCFKSKYASEMPLSQFFFKSMPNRAVFSPGSDNLLLQSIFDIQKKQYYAAPVTEQL